MTATDPNKPTPQRASDSQDLGQSGGWVLPRRLKLGVVWGWIAGFIGVITIVVSFGFAVKNEAEAAALAAGAAQKTADEGPRRVMELIAPRLESLETDRDVAQAERKSTASEISAVRLYLCRECERHSRQRAACDDICMRVK